MKTKSLIPWLVTERDFRRYLGRALDACRHGRVLFFYHIERAKREKTLVALTPCQDWKKALESAHRSFEKGRVKQVRLEDFAARGKL